MSRFSMSVNITPVERVARVVVGLAAVVGAAVLLGVESPAEGDTALRLPQLISNQLIVVLCVVTPLLALLASWAPAMLAARQDPALELSRD